MDWTISKSTATCRTSPSWRPSITARSRGSAATAAGARTAQAAARLALALFAAFALWIAAAPGASADAAPPGELIIDFRPRDGRALIPDAGLDPTRPRGPGPSYTRNGAATLTGVRVTPWPPKQGQTLALHLQSARPVTYTLTFGGRSYRVNTAEGGSGGAWALVPVPPLTLPGYVRLAVQAGPERFTLNVPVHAGRFESVNIPAATAGPILSERAKVSAEAARMTELFDGYTSGGWTPRSRFAPPLTGDFRHSSPFGGRRTYGNDPALSAHAGEDYSAPPGTPAYAPAPGTVVLAEALFVRGNAVVLDHGHGVYTGYWHLSELGVKPGDAVETGQLLGKVGSTGLSTGAHLHWELRVAGMAVDPLQWLK